MEKVHVIVFVLILIEVK